MVSAVQTVISLTALAICSDTSWLGIRWDVEAVATDTFLGVLAELSLSVFSATGCLMVQYVDVSLCIASASVVALQNITFALRREGAEEQIWVVALASWVGLSSLI